MLLSGSSLESSARCAARQGAALPVMQPAARPVLLSIRGHRPQNMQEGGISIRLDKLSRCLDVIILYDFLCCISPCVIRQIKAKQDVFCGFT